MCMVAEGSVRHWTVAFKGVQEGNSPLVALRNVEQAANSSTTSSRITASTTSSSRTSAKAPMAGGSPAPRTPSNSGSGSQEQPNRLPQRLIAVHAETPMSADPGGLVAQCAQHSQSIVVVGLGECVDREEDGPADQLRGGGLRHAAGEIYPVPPSCEAVRDPEIRQCTSVRGTAGVVVGDVEDEALGAV